MIKIFICHEDDNLLDEININVSKIILIENYDMKIEILTSNTKNIMEYLKNYKDISIFILGVNFNSGINGIKLAEEIRKIVPVAFFIFVEKTDDAIKEIIKKNIAPINFITYEENIKNEIYKSLNAIYLRYSMYFSGVNEVFKIKNKDKIIVENYNNIIMFCTSNKAHKISMISINISVDFYGTLKKIKTLLNKDFIKINNFCIINKNYIKFVNYKEKTLILHNEQSFKISKRLFSNVKSLI